MKTATMLVGLALALSAPAQTWVVRYDGPANDEDYTRALASDGAGNTYVTGASWGAGGYDYATVKYGPDGSERWVARYDGPAGGSDEATAIAVRGDRVAVTGGSARDDLFTDIVTILYDTDGNRLWTARYNGPNDGNDMGLAVAFDPDGNVLVAGYSIGTDILWDFITIKYGADGRELWTARYSTDDEDYAVAVAADAAGNVIVCGPSGCPYTFAWDYLTLKYDPDGAELWVARYNGPADEHDEPRAMALDPAGNIYVTGGSSRPGSGADFTTIKYRPDGETLWVRRYDGPAGSADWGNAIALDAAGNAYVAGSSMAAATAEDFATVKYAPDGTELWARRYNGPADGFDEARAVAVNETGVYVTGSSLGEGTRTDYATLKYDLDGGLQWVERYDGPASRFDEPVAIVLDRSGGVVVTGSSIGSGTGTDYATVRYPAVGVAETPPAAHPVAGLPPTIVRGVLMLGAGHDRNPPGGFGSCPKPAVMSHTALLDITGRKVMELQSGENDVRHLAPGVYFIRGAGHGRNPPGDFGPCPKPVKVVIQR